MSSPKATSWLYDHNLILMGAGLLLASSAIDGVYMGNAMMPVGYAGFGLLLNLVSDICTLGLSYWYRRLRMDRSSVKRKGAWVLLLTEVIAAGYSWLFSWRQLLQVMPRVEGTDAIWLAPLAAGFVPMLLFAIGYAEASRIGRMEIRTAKKDTRIPISVPAESVDEIRNTRIDTLVSDNGGNGLYRMCEPCEFPAYSQQAWAGHCKGHKHKENMAHVQP